MLIRDRVLLVAVLALLSIAATGLWLGDMRVRDMAEASSRQAVTAQAALWHAAVEGKLDALDNARPLLAAHLSGAADPEAALARAHAELAPQFGISRLDLIGNDGRLVARVPAMTRIGAGSAPLPMWRGGRGIGQNEARGYVLYGTAALDGATLVASLPLAGALETFARAAGVPAALVDLRGRAVSVAGDGALDELIKSLPRFGEDAYTVDFGGGAMEVVSTFVNDPGGRPLAHLLTVRAGGGAQQVALASRPATLALLALVCLAVTAIVAWYVRTALAPVEGAVEALERLADGDTALSLPTTAETDESGRLIAAARSLRARAMTFASLRVARERQGQRQQRFIRMQMEALANMLQPEARTSVLGDLTRLEEAAREAAAARHGDAHGVEAGEDFGLLAAAFENMAVRIRDQYAALGSLVRELSEALKAKNEFVALQKELEIARRLQLSILPHSFEPRDGLVIQASMTPAKEVGGDFYDFFEIDDDRIGVVVADVSGKGVPAALFMAISRTLLRAIGLIGESPGRVLARLNDLLAAENEEMMFVTVFYGVVEPKTGRMTYANGGHNLPMCLRAGGEVEVLPSLHGTALAVMPGLDYKEAVLQFAPGDVLLLYTDGVTEAFDIDDQEFGDAALKSVMAGFGKTRTQEVPQAVVDAVYRFARGAPQSDDITCVALGYQRKE